MGFTTQLRSGHRVGYALYGDETGAPLVLLHGFSDSRLTGGAFAEAAARTRTRLVVPDRPGTGLSTGSIRSFAAFARWLAELADALGLGRFPVAGVSGGGPFALAAGRYLPDRVLRVTVVSGLGPPEHGVEGMPRGQRLGIAVARRAPAASAAIMAGVAALARRRPDWFLALVRMNTSAVDRDAVSREALLEPYLEAYRRGAGGVRDELRLILRPWDFRPEEIRVPVRFEHGEEDATVPPSAARALAARVPGAVPSIRAGVGHFSLPPRYADEVLRLAVGRLPP